MEHVIEHFGVGFLQMISGAMMTALFFALLHHGGTISNIVAVFMGTICGA